LKNIESIIWLKIIYTDVMHYIQKYILNILTHQEFARFSDMRPPRIDSNAYSYHLRALQKDKYVEKTDQGYRLAPEGLRYVDSLSFEDLKPRKQPKLITILALHDGAGSWLLAERKVQPYIGKLMFPSGKQHRGETREQQAVRELRENMALQTVPLVFRGTADVQISDTTGELITHIFGHVYEGQIKKSYLPPENDRFRYVWHDFSEVNNVSLAGTQDLYHALQKPGQFDLTIAAHLLQ